MKIESLSLFLVLFLAVPSLSFAQCNDAKESLSIVEGASYCRCVTDSTVTYERGSCRMGCAPETAGENNICDIANSLCLEPSCIDVGAGDCQDGTERPREQKISAITLPDGVRQKVCTVTRSKICIPIYEFERDPKRPDVIY